MLDEKKADELVEAMTVMHLSGKDTEEGKRTDEQIKDQVTGNKPAIQGNK